MTEETNSSHLRDPAFGPGRDLRPPYGCKVFVLFPGFTTLAGRIIDSSQTVGDKRFLTVTVRQFRSECLY